MNKDFWRGRRVLVTGHSGFKGGWLSAWLLRAGSTVCGIALAPETQPNLYAALDLAARMDSRLLDITDYAATEAVFRDFRPDTVFHLAAQALVRRSYREPLRTLATNVLGTAHVFEAARAAGSVKAIVNVTSDKCYANREWHWGYRENEPMGGHDPYSSSKGCAELVTAAWRDSFCGAEGIALGSARAGNVFGGGDWAEDRLIPDLVRAFAAGVPAPVRNPAAVRPWQFVLEALHGYLLLAERLHADPVRYARGWNFGPDASAEVAVRQVADALVRHWGGDAGWRDEADPSAPHEARFLKLDSSEARACLGWRPVLELDEALAQTAHWYRAAATGSRADALVVRQLEDYEARLEACAERIPA
jgi:CDP-glucose 4,6-dehydratase